MSWLSINPLSANPTKWSNTLKQFVGKLPTNCLSVFDHFVGLALKGLNSKIFEIVEMFCYLGNIIGAGGDAVNIVVEVEKIRIGWCNIWMVDI